MEALALEQPRLNRALHRYDSWRIAAPTEQTIESNECAIGR